MRRLFFLLMIAAGFSGCVKLQMPDDMISDTVQAGRDIYEDTKDSDENELELDGTEGRSIFTHTVVDASDSPELELRTRCLSELKSRAAELVASNDIVFTVITESITIRDDKAIVSCTTSID